MNALWNTYNIFAERDNLNKGGKGVTLLQWYPLWNLQSVSFCTQNRGTLQIAPRKKALYAQNSSYVLSLKEMRQQENVHVLNVVAKNGQIENILVSETWRQFAQNRPKKLWFQRFQVHRTDYERRETKVVLRGLFDSFVEKNCNSV